MEIKNNEKDKDKSEVSQKDRLLELQKKTKKHLRKL